MELPHPSHDLLVSIIHAGQVEVLRLTPQAWTRLCQQALRAVSHPEPPCTDWRDLAQRVQDAYAAHPRDDRGASAGWPGF